MLVPVLCFTCGKLIGDKWVEYQTECEKKEKTKQEILDNIGFNRYCCRNIFMCHTDLINNIVEDNSIYQKKN